MPRKRPANGQKEVEKFRLQPAIDGQDDAPCLRLDGTGKQSYLWIGNHSREGGFRCYAMLFGGDKLERLAREILIRVNS